MICPSSSEEELDVEKGEEEISNLTISPQNQKLNSSPQKTETYSLTPIQASRSSSIRGISPSPSSTGDEVDQKQRQEEEEERRLRLQLYVFVLRCITTPFNAKQPTDMSRRQAKVNKQQLQAITDRFASFLGGATKIAVFDDAFYKAVSRYYEVFLKSDRVMRMVQSGGCCDNDFREVFRSNLEKRVSLMPEIDGLSKENIFTTWMAKFNVIYRGEGDLPAPPAPEVVMGKNQLYDMFQDILGIKKFEHQLLYNACQLDNLDEQTAAIRRELDGRSHTANKIEVQGRFPRFHISHSEQESRLQRQYIEELRAQVNLLMANLDALPLTPRSSTDKYPLRRFRGLQQTSLEQSTEKDSLLSKLNLVLKFTLQVVVVEAQGLKSIAPDKVLYCTMEVDGGEKLQTIEAEARHPVWETEGDFTTTCPVPQLKIKLYSVVTGMLSIDDKELGRVVLCPTLNTPRTAEWYPAKSPKNSTDQQIKIKLIIRMDCPSLLKRMDSPSAMKDIEDSSKNSDHLFYLKHFGYLWAQGRSVWKKWKRQYFMLLQVSQCNFMLCSYQEKKPEPVERMHLEGFTVDYTVPDNDYEGGRAFFNAVKEGDLVTFASDDEQDRIMWVQAMYRATGQSHKPVPPTQVQKLSKKKGGQIDAPVTQFHADRARKHGMDEFIAADPCKYDHSSLFELLQRLTLDHRLNDSYSCLGWFSPGQIFVLDEYCARYGVRGCHRHLCYLSDLLERAQADMMIDPTLLHYSYAFCSSHMDGSRPDGIATITLDEKNRFCELRDRLKAHLIHQVTYFRYCFPFGRPKGALKATLSLIERVEMPDSVTQAPPSMIRNIVKKCLQDAAYINYTRVSKYAKIEESLEDDSENQLKIVTCLAELCIDVLSQNEEHHYEAFAWFSDLLTEHAEIFWSLFSVDMDNMLEKQPPDTWDSFPLFQRLNEFLLQNENLKSGKFHCHLRDQFAPLVVRYIDLMESSIAQSIHKGFERDGLDMSKSSNVGSDVLWKLDVLQTFALELNWPDAMFASHIEHRLKQMASDMIQSVVARALLKYNKILESCRVSVDLQITTALCSYIKIILDCREQSAKLCASGQDASGTQHQYHVQVEGVLTNACKKIEELLVFKFGKVLQSVLAKLARYDEGSFTASLLTLTKPGMELANNFVNFVRCNQDILRGEIMIDTFLESLYLTWYRSSMKILSEWLEERPGVLHIHQLKTLIKVFKKLNRDFEMNEGDEIRNKHFRDVHERLTVEETTTFCKSGALGDNITMKVSDNELDSDG